MTQNNDLDKRHAICVPTATENIVRAINHITGKKLSDLKESGFAASSNILYMLADINTEYHEFKGFLPPQVLSQPKKFAAAYSCYVESLDPENYHAHAASEIVMEDIKKEFLKDKGMVKSQ